VRGLYAEIDALVEAVDSLSPRGMCLVFGVCERALSPLLRQVEQRSQGNWAVFDLALAQDVIEAFATGRAESGDHQGLRNQLMVKVPGDHPWSTYGQDVLICARGALAAASTDEPPKPVLIQYALEPLTAFMEDRDADMIRQRGDAYWSEEIVKDPAMAVAIDFLRKLVERASQETMVDSVEFIDLAEAGSVLRPE
jgi:hypothetical protein